jgi:hypothetical protein
MRIPEIIVTLVQNEIPVSIVQKEIDGEKQIGFEVDGFYKSGTVFLLPTSDRTFTAISRYNERTDIAFIEDLVALNYEWWDRSKDRGFDGWKSPDCRWMALLEKGGYVKTEMQKVVVPLVKGSR